MNPRAVIFDLFHTLTGPEAEWSDLPWTSDVLGIDRRLWNELLITRSQWRLTGEERDPHVIVRTLAHQLDPTIPDERIREATRCRIQRFKDSLTRSPADCLFVGDGGSNELLGAKEAGMPTVFVSGIMASLWPDRINERLATCDYHIERIPDLLLMLGVIRHEAVGANGELVLGTG